MTHASFRLAEALDAVSDIYVLYDSEFRILYHNEANRAAMRTVGIDPDQAIGQVVTDVLPFLEGTTGMNESRRAMRERVPTSWEESYHENLRLRGRAYPAGADQLVVMAQNVTAEWHARQRAEGLERKASDEMARVAHWTRVQHELALGLAAATNTAHIAEVILESARTAFGAERGRVLSVDADGDTARVVGSFGFTDEQVAGWEQYSIRERSAAVIRAVETHEPQFYETPEDFARSYPELARLAARNLSVALTVLPIVAQGRVIALISLGWGAPRPFPTEERAVLQTMALQCAGALQRAWAFDAETLARTIAEDANRAKAQFLAAMSHELRTPLNAIGGYAELLMMGIHGPIAEQQADDLHRIIRNQRHLLTIINDILNFARLEAATLDFDSAPVSVRALVDSIEPLIAPQMRDKGIAYLVGDIPDDLAMTGDEERIRQAMINLLSNAVKFTNAGGAVRIDSSCTSESASIIVRDTGIGIPADRMGSIFDPFVQAHRSLTQVTSGTGLGLAISRELARHMGGDISVESVLEEGSIFTLTLPRAVAHIR